ncbi:MAG: zf-HC2 domain-containing protein [Polaromonas sp.]|uniref:zf-HC2 domain-containing protein n=1 Tax=Polaromonas sp. TaxID=1869339 RepID=UPI00248913E5|nr:zf-HC2 domain-containing protein [Polaromonas sp.]MDI1236717.1 zf-HC2 domain-containing protein [Polaromonas sp.]MDI1340281.1 zf-HC2 domain-containing protein [Polaromonas sp.]
MKIQSLPLRRTCKQAAALLVAREDRALRLADTVALRLHLLACKACPQFENQLLTMRLAMGRWRNYAGETESPDTEGLQRPD